MIYNNLKASLLTAKREARKADVADLIGVIDAVDKKVFVERKKSSEDFVIEDQVVIGVLKNQAKNVGAAYVEAMKVVGQCEATNSMLDTLTILRSFLPPAVEGDALRLIIQDLGAKNLGQAMGLLKKQSISHGFDYNGAEAAEIAKEIFV